MVFVATVVEVGRAMASLRAYYDDSYTTRFSTRVAATGEHSGRPAIELETTYFFPEGGGQEADRGKIAEFAVIDVQAGDEGRVWHVLEGGRLPSGEIEAELDWARRFDHMQQHTGQHILSAAFERVLDAPTLSSHLGIERNSIELGLADVDWKTIDRLERAANAVVWEDRPIERHWVDDEGVKRFALRKPPKFTGRIRIVEIPEWDVSACGGTHTRRTGEVGLIKIVRWEKVRGNLRFEFLCGGRALDDYAWRTESLLEAARRRTLKDRDLIAHLERAAAERDELKKRLQDLVARLVAVDAVECVAKSPGGVSEFSTERPRDEARLFAIKCLEAGAPWVVVGAAAPDPIVIAARAKGEGADLRKLLPGLLERARGKGGGGADFLQVAAADAVAAEEAWRWMSASAREAVSGSS